MNCKKCPHYVRHGQLNPKTNTIEFKDACGILLRQAAKLQEKENNKKASNKDKTPSKEKTITQKQEIPLCKHYPFSQDFNHTECDIYQNYFKSISYKTDIMADAQDLQLSDIFNSSSTKITDLDIL